MAFAMSPGSATCSDRTPRPLARSAYRPPRSSPPWFCQGPTSFGVSRWPSCCCQHSKWLVQHRPAADPPWMKLAVHLFFFPAACRSQLGAVSGPGEFGWIRPVRLFASAPTTFRRSWMLLFQIEVVRRERADYFGSHGGLTDENETHHLLHQEWRRVDSRCTAIETFGPGIPSTGVRRSGRVSAPKVGIDFRRGGPTQWWRGGRK
jgi:hypothetical protein